MLKFYNFKNQISDLNSTQTNRLNTSLIFAIFSWSRIEGQGFVVAPQNSQTFPPSIKTLKSIINCPKSPTDCDWTDTLESLRLSSTSSRLVSALYWRILGGPTESIVIDDSCLLTIENRLELTLLLAFFSDIELNSDMFSSSEFISELFSRRISS